MNRDKEASINVKFMTPNVLKKGFETAQADDRISVDGDSEILVFLGEPENGLQLQISGIAARQGLGGDKDRIVLIVEPNMQNMVERIERSLGLKERGDSLEGELGMKPPTPGCDCEACIEKRRFIDLCNETEAQMAKDTGNLN